MEQSLMRLAFLAHRSAACIVCGGDTLKQLRLPLRDLVRVNVELLRQLGQRLVPLHGG